MDPKTKRANEDQRERTQGLFHNIRHAPKISYCECVFDFISRIFS